MLSAAKIASLLALLPSVLACNGYTGGLPTATGTKTNSKVITIAAGQTFDCGWAKYDRGSGACSGQTEGGKKSPFLLSSFTSSIPPILI
jgi:hypothetical protein